MTFQSTREELRALDWRFFVIGLIGTWAVGMGRHWDSPVAVSWAQRLGLGSVVYVFVLSLLLYLAALPLRPSHWTYPSVLTFITLTSFPAILYAIPVERMFAIEVASQINVSFLIVVAIYRVALYLTYMYRSAELDEVSALVAVFLPIFLVIMTVVQAGYSKEVFGVMAGLRDPTSLDGEYTVIEMIGMVACYGTPIWLLCYIAMILVRSRDRYRL